MVSDDNAQRSPELWDKSISDVNAVMIVTKFALIMYRERFYTVC